MVLSLIPLRLRMIRGCSMVMALSLTAIMLTSCGHSIDPSSISTLPTRASLTKVDNSLDKLAAQNPPPSDTSNEFARQSQRDVEAVLQARNATSPTRSTALGSQPQSLPEAPPLGANPPAQGSNSPRKTIVWNDPRTGKPVADRPAAATQGSSVGNAGAQPQSSLFKPLNAPAESISATQPAAGATSRPSLEPDRLRHLMVDLSRELYATGAYSEAPLRQLMMIAAMSMIDPDRKLEPQAIPDLTDKERELLGYLQAFFADLGKSLDGSPDAEKSIVEAVAKLRESIVKEPQLTLATVALCTRVGGYGDFTEFDKRAFLALAEQKAIVYLEIEDFTSQLNSKSEYVTEISQQLTIYNDRDGIPVWRGDWQAAVDVTKNKRQDFFTVQVITLPKALSVGKYHLKVRARDEKSGAEAENSLDFEMVADPKMAATVK